MNHVMLMQRCLELAKKGRGKTGSNPLVGSVIVRDDTIIGQGWYEGGDHAERIAIKNCDQEIEQGDRLYVNLEPCCHTGKTPPCTDLILESGIGTVIFGMQDPDQRVAGKGIEQLRAQGVEVIGPVLRAECERLNRGYISVRTKNRPYIILKKAQTGDGKVANDDGSKLCITSDEQNTWSHSHLRSKVDAILVGVGTVLIDDPQLTIRLNKKVDQNMRQPNAVILDPHLRIPLDANVVREGTVIVRDSAETGKQAEEKSLADKGARVITIPRREDHFDFEALWEALDAEEDLSLSSILVEGGPKTWATFQKAGLVDEEITLIGNEGRG